MSRFFMVHCVY